MKIGAEKLIGFFIPLLFLVYTAPGLLDYVFTYPDEKHYTDAAFQMIEKEDYFTPYQADGNPRFLKPITTYWVLIASYKIFGVSPFSSRIMFWLAGALLVLVTFFMSKSITRSRSTAAVASFITAANPLVIMSAGRSIPDILLVLFLTVSAWGFIEILLREKPSKIYYWLAYAGAAFAFETKGIPAAAFGGVSILFLLFNPWKRKKITQVFEPFSLMTAIVIALGWFVVMYIEHGSEYLSSFYTDQVGERVSLKVLQVFKNAFWSIITLVVIFIPWMFIAFSSPAKLKAWITSSSEKSKAIIGFILIWVVLIILMSGAVFKFYDRYVLPVVPLTAMLLAMIFTNVETSGKKVFSRIFLVLAFILLVTNISLQFYVAVDFLLVVGILFTVTVCLLWVFGFFQSFRKEIILANLVLLLIFNVFILARTILMPNHGEQLASYIHSNSETEKIYVYGSYSLAANLRVHSKNEFTVVGKNKDYTLPKEFPHLLLFTKDEVKHLKLDNYKTTKAAEELSRIKAEHFPDFLKPVVTSIKSNSKIYIIAEPKINEKSE